MPEPQPLFFALLPPPAVRRALAGAAESVPPPARPVHPQDLHLTLAFLGRVSPAPELLEAGEAAAAARGFVLRLDRFGCWRRAGIAWAAPGSPPEPLAALHGRLTAALACRGRPVERRDFRPHVTLARRARRAPQASMPPPWRITELVLMVSGPPPAPRYRVHARWPLAEV